MITIDNTEQRNFIDACVAAVRSTSMNGALADFKKVWNSDKAVEFAQADPNAIKIAFNEVIHATHSTRREQFAHAMFVSPTMITLADWNPVTYCNIVDALMPKVMPTRLCATGVHRIELDNVPHLSGVVAYGVPACNNRKPPVMQILVRSDAVTGDVRVLADALGEGLGNDKEHRATRRVLEKHFRSNARHIHDNETRLAFTQAATVIAPSRPFRDFAGALLMELAASN